VFEGDFYKFLGVPQDSSPEDVKKAYRKLALKYHPDLGVEKDDHAMQNLNYVYATLGDPVLRRSYDDSIAYAKRSTSSYHRTAQRPREERAEAVVEDYHKAVFVDGTQAKDSKGSYSYIRPDDYIYYPVSVRKKILFFGYTGRDYYRVNVKKIYSRKRNSFKKVPIFVVSFGDLEQVVFEQDFANFWLSETGYRKMEKQKALVTFGVGMTILGLALYKLLTLQ
jgi:DnaJ-class molecular chaperone